MRKEQEGGFDPPGLQVSSLTTIREEIWKDQNHQYPACPNPMNARAGS